jgi:hypothetical protein
MNPAIGRILDGSLGEFSVEIFSQLQLREACRLLAGVGALQE